MRRKIRRIIFYVCFLAFLVISYITLLYAQGYKYSFSENKFFRTGAVSLRANTEAKVFLQDELIGTTSFLTNSFSQDRLLPGLYTIRLQKDEYSSWQKAVLVEEGKVVDFPRILLLPQSEEKLPEVIQNIEEAFLAENIILNPTPTPRIRPSPSPAIQPESNIPFSLKGGKLTRTESETEEIISTHVAGFALSESKKQLLWWTNNELWVLWLENIEDHQPYRRAGDKELITRFTSPIKRAAWFKGEDHVVVEANGFRVVEIDKRGGINIIKI